MQMQDAFSTVGLGQQGCEGEETPTVPSLTPQADAELLVTSPTLQQATAVESNAEPALALPAQDRIITLHQILV